MYWADKLADEIIRRKETEFTPMTEEEALQESRRCLRCDHFGYGIFKGGRVEKW